jgi:hypothetical protein
MRFGRRRVESPEAAATRAQAAAERAQQARDQATNRAQAQADRERAERLADRAAQEQYEAAQREERARLGRERIAHAVRTVGFWFPTDIYAPPPGHPGGRPRTLKEWLAAAFGGPR